MTVVWGARVVDSGNISKRQIQAHSFNVVLWALYSASWCLLAKQFPLDTFNRETELWCEVSSRNSLCERHSSSNKSAHTGGVAKGQHSPARPGTARYGSVMLSVMHGDFQGIFTSQIDALVSFDRANLIRKMAENKLVRIFTVIKQACSLAKCCNEEWKCVPQRVL
jgi:hypothetical protein